MGKDMSGSLVNHSSTFFQGSSFLSMANCLRFEIGFSGFGLDTGTGNKGQSHPQKHGYDQCQSFGHHTTSLDVWKLLSMLRRRTL
jgi:hypothetical protein